LQSIVISDSFVYLIYIYIDSVIELGGM